MTSRSTLIQLLEEVVGFKWKRTNSGYAVYMPNGLHVITYHTLNNEVKERLVKAYHYYIDLASGMELNEYIEEA